MRALAIAALGATFGLAYAEPSLTPVTLDTRALETLKQTNPDHFRKATEVVRVASEKGCASAAKILKAQFDVTNAHCEPLLYRTSDPPKQRLTFTLEGTPYDIYLTVRPRDRRGDLRKSEDAPK